MIYLCGLKRIICAQCVDDLSKSKQKMREIKFRGLSSGNWVFGDLVKTPNNNYKYAIKDTPYNVNNGKINLIPSEIQNSETIGQFTGLKDKNGVEIYEGDIVKYGSRITQLVFKQEFCRFWLIWNDIDGLNRYESLIATYGDDTGHLSNDSLEVIGNIYQTPDVI